MVLCSTEGSGTGNLLRKRNLRASACSIGQFKLLEIAIKTCWKCICLVVSSTFIMDQAVHFQVLSKVIVLYFWARLLTLIVLLSSNFAVLLLFSRQLFSIRFQFSNCNISGACPIDSATPRCQPPPPPLQKILGPPLIVRLTA